MAKVIPFPHPTIPSPPPEPATQFLSAPGVVGIINDGCEEWISLKTAEDMRDGLTDAIEMARWLAEEPL